MKLLIGLLLVIIGIGVGLYFGIYWAFIKGIILIIEQIRATDMNSVILAWGIARVFFAGLIGWLSALFFLIPGIAFIQSDKY
jgi:hypothetical protein